MSNCSVCCNIRSKSLSKEDTRFSIIWLLCQIFSNSAASGTPTDGQSVAITDVANHDVLPAPGVGKALVITSIDGTNGGNLGTYTVLKKGTTEFKRSFSAPQGGGFALMFPTGIRLAENTALRAANIVNGAEVYVSAEGYIVDV